MEMEGCGQFQSPLCYRDRNGAHKMKGDFEKKEGAFLWDRSKEGQTEKDPGQPEPGAVAPEHVEFDETFKITKSHHLDFPEVEAVTLQESVTAFRFQTAATMARSHIRVTAVTRRALSSPPIKQHMNALMIAISSEFTSVSAPV